MLSILLSNSNDHPKSTQFLNLRTYINANEQTKKNKTHYNSNNKQWIGLQILCTREWFSRQSKSTGKAIE